MVDLVRGYCVDRDEWVYGELLRDSGDSTYAYVLAGEGISYEVYRESIGRMSPWVQECGASIYEGDPVVIRLDETASTRGAWGADGVVFRFGIVVVVDGEFEIELNDGSLMGVSLVESELDDMGTRMMLTVDRNEYELSQSYYMLTIRGYVFGSRDGVEFEDHMEPLTFEIARDEWGTERVYQELAKGFSELGADISEEGRYRVLMCSQSSVTVRDDWSGDDVYRFSEELVYDVGGKRLKRPTSYVCVSVSSVAMETCVFPLFIQDGYSELDVIEGVRESARLDFLPIVSDRFLDSTELLDRVVESNVR